MSTDDRALGAEFERVQNAIRDLGPVQADPRFRARLRHEFVTGKIAERAGARRRSLLAIRRAWLLAPAAAVAGATVWLLMLTASPSWEIRDVSDAGVIAIRARQGPAVEVPASDRVRLAELIRPGVQIRLPEHGTLDLVVKDVLLLRLDEQAVLTVPGNPGKGKVMVSRLDAGELRIRTGPAFGGQRLSVQTTEGRTELSGTVVSVFKGDDFTCVCVFEGTARIGKTEATLEEVPEGMRKVMFAGERPSKVVAIEAHHAEGLAEFLETTQDVFD